MSRHMTTGAVLLVLLLAFFPVPDRGAGAEQPSAGPLPASETGARLQALLEEVLTDADIPGALLVVDAPALGLAWQGAAGVSARGGRRLAPGATVRLASNTKTFVAVTVLRLWEENRLDLDDPVQGYLTRKQNRILREDGYDPGSITLRHLLSHTAGLVDHGAQEEYIQAVLADPQRRWTREDQLTGMAAWGDPLGPPGRSFSYSDSGYILLGRVIEKVTGGSLAAAVRRQVGFERLGLDATWWEDVEAKPPAAGPRAHQYLGELDTHDWSPSMDLYGGGGLVASMADLARFWRALFTGRVFAQESTLQVLLSSPVEPVVDGYRLGVFQRDFNGLLAYEHSGFWGTRAAYIPELDMVVAGAVTQQNKARRVFRLLEDAVAMLRPQTAPDGDPGA